MTAFVLMGQTLRVEECVEFLRRDAHRWTVVVGDLHGMSEDRFPPVSELVVMDSPLAGAGSRFRADLRRSATSWMRRGSRIGRMAENGIRTIRRIASIGAIPNVSNGLRWTRTSASVRCRATSEWGRPPWSVR